MTEFCQNTAVILTYIKGVAKLCREDFALMRGREFLEAPFTRIAPESLIK